MQDILIHAREFAERTAACRYGVQLAEAFGAALTAVYVHPSPLYVGRAYDPALVAAIAEEARAHVAEAVEAGDAFVRWASSSGAPRAEWVVGEGYVTDALVSASTRHDLMVLDHPQDAEMAAWDMPGLVLRSACPCIVLPRRAVDYEPSRPVAIGWNGSPEATRAVHAALPFLRGRQVLLLRGEERERYPLLQWHPRFDIEDYLAQRGVAVTARTLTAKPSEVGTALLDEAVGFGAGLLVMGAYGRTRFSEWLLGGATRDVLTWARLPVLLQH